MTLTTERLREIAEDGFLEHGDAKLMARELLDNREAQPVGYIADCGTIICESDPFFDDYKNPQPLFTTQPAVPEEMPKDLAGQIVSLLAHNIGDKLLAQKIWNACRATMLDRQNVDHVVDAAQKVEPVSQGCELPNAWIPRDERIPKDGDVVLVFQEGGIIFCAEVDDGEFYPDEFPRVPTQGKEITHWMPLPAAPQPE